MESSEVKRSFLRFFEERGHRELPSSSLVPPPGDPVLLTTSGMHPLTENLLGQLHPSGVRLSSVQRCVRTTDLDEVGDETHLTMFEMLGSWSLGGDEVGGDDGVRSVQWGVELLNRLGIGVERLHGTVYGGTEGEGPDVPSEVLLGSLGVPVERLEEN